MCLGLLSCRYVQITDEWAIINQDKKLLAQCVQSSYVRSGVHVAGIKVAMSRNCQAPK